MTGDEVYLDLDDVIRIHGRIFGVSSTVARDQLRDAGALESAILRPRNTPPTMAQTWRARRLSWPTVSLRASPFSTAISGPH